MPPYERPSGRAPDALRPVRLRPGYARHAEGSCLVELGATRVLCTASVSGRVPSFVRNTGRGWITAEYGMLPRSTHSRTDREAVRGKQSGRTQEIQRLIGRSLRAVTDLTLLGERQIVVDCDVLQADGGTRTAAITGASVALLQAFLCLMERGEIGEIPLECHVAAISCGLYRGEVLLDLDYAEDSDCETDANFVMADGGGLVEVQATAEKEPFDEGRFAEMMRLAYLGTQELFTLQHNVL